MRLPRVWLFVVLLSATGCVTGLNYVAPDGPRYAGGKIADAPVRLHGDTLTVVSFNIQYAIHIDSALVVLQNTPALRDADIVLLQEMDEPGTQRIADALHMAYVYYPASKRKDIKRDWGNAVLARWPIVKDNKLVLPHIGKLAKTMRAATGVTMLVAGVPVRVYSAHLGTIWNVGPGGRRDQLRTIIADAAAYDHVIIGGDMNSETVGKVAADSGFAWPTSQIPKSTRYGRLDHFFVRGLTLPDTAAGTVPNNHHASDHRPVWLRVILKP